MKIPVLIIVSLLLTPSSQGQKDSSLSGSWKLIALSNEGMYYDLSKDSLWVSTTIEKEIGNAEEKKRFKESLQLYDGVTFDFKSDGAFTQTLKHKMVSEGTYKVIPEERLLEFKTEDDVGRFIISKIRFELKDNRLWLFIKSKEKLFDYLLEKN